MKVLDWLQSAYRTVRGPTRKEYLALQLVQAIHNDRLDKLWKQLDQFNTWSESVNKEIEEAANRAIEEAEDKERLRLEGGLGKKIDGRIANWFDHWDYIERSDVDQAIEDALEAFTPDPGDDNIADAVVKILSESTITLDLYSKA